LINQVTVTYSTNENDTRNIHMAELATKDTLKNAVLPDVTSIVWNISPDISEEHAGHILQDRKDY
jgi:hypothetical protein